MGLIFMYMGLFLYETEEGTMQNRLEEWWIRIDERRGTEELKSTNFLIQVAALSNRFLDWLFGKQLLSMRMVCVSMCFSLASIYLMFFATSVSVLSRELPAGIVSAVTSELPRLLLMSCLLVGWGWLGREWKSPVGRTIWAVGVLGLLVLSFEDLKGGLELRGFREFRTVPNFELFETSLCIVVISLGLLSDIMFVSMTRGLLRRCAKSQSTTEVVGITSANLLLALFLLLAPAYISAQLGDAPFPFFAVGFMVAVSNVFSGLCALVFGMVSVVLLLHRILWPFVERLLYLAARQGVARRRKSLVVLGALLVGFAIPCVRTVMEKLVMMAVGG